MSAWSLYALFAAKWCHLVQNHAKLHDCQESGASYLNPCCQAITLESLPDSGKQSLEEHCGYGPLH